MTLHLVQAATELPVSLDEAKAHLVVEHDLDDDLITDLISAATQHLDGPDGILGMALIRQTWRLETARPCDRIVRLGLGPADQITEVSGLTDGASVAFDLAGIRLGQSALGPFAALQPSASWPGSDVREDALQITFTCGVQTAAEVPAPIRQAIRLLVGHWYVNREAVVISGQPIEPPLAVKALLAPFRVRRL